MTVEVAPDTVAVAKVGQADLEMEEVVEAAQERAVPLFGLAY